MKNWPENNKPVDFESLVGPLVSSFRYAFDVKRKNEGKDVPYRGYDHGALAHARSGNDQLKVENLTYARDEQNRDELTTLISLAVMVGIEQGRRIEYTRTEVERLLLKVMLEKFETKED